MAQFTVQTNLSNRYYVERQQEKESQPSRTGEYALLLGFVFIAAIITIVVVGTQVAQLISASSSL